MIFGNAISPFSVRILGVAAISDLWILHTGFWRDVGVWEDSDVWND